MCVCVSPDLTQGGFKYVTMRLSYTVVDLYTRKPSLIPIYSKSLALGLDYF